MFAAFHTYLMQCSWFWSKI